MDNSFAITAAFAGARAVHFAACMLLVAVCVLDRFIAAPALKHGGPAILVPWRSIGRRIVAIALPAALLSGAAWLGVIAVEMSGLSPAEALRWETLRTVLDQTQFGKVWKVRGCIYLAATLTSIPAFVPRGQSAMRAAFAWITLIFSGLLVLSLAWAGHGADSGRWHLVADALHLLISGAWPAGLLPFALLLLKLRRAPAGERRPAVYELARRFSVLSLCSVLLLGFTGLVNSWFLLGPVSNLWRVNYGRVLLVKISLFGLMIGFGAINLFYLKPRLAPERTDPAKAESLAHWLRWNVMTEVVLAILVILAVAILGLLPPGSMCDCPM